MNITEIMANQKPFKIRQTFRKLILDLLNLENLMLYIYHSESSTVEFHDFKNNYISDTPNEEKTRAIENIIKEGNYKGKNQAVMQVFDLIYDPEDSYKWDVSKDHKNSVVFAYKQKEKTE